MPLDPNGQLMPEMPPAPVDMGPDDAGDEAPAAETKNLSPMELRQREQAVYRQKIDKATSRNERLLEAMSRSDDRWQQAQNKIAELEQMVKAQSQPQRQPNELDRFKDEELRKAKYQYLTAETAEERQKAYAIEEELERRREDRMVQRLEDSLGKERQNNQMTQEARSAYYEAARLLGDEDGGKFVDFATGAIKPTRESKIADIVLNNIRQKRGDAVAKTPEMHAYALLLANQAVKAERAKTMKAESRQEEGNLLRSRVNDQVSAKGEAAPETVSRVQAALKANDLNGAISELPFVKASEEKRKTIIAQRHGIR